MPTYRVTVCNHLDQTVEEIYHAIQRCYHTMTYLVDAEDEAEANDLVLDGIGDLVDEEYDYGDILDSEYYQMGEVLDEECVDTEIEEIVEDAEYVERMRRQMEETRRAMANWRATHGWTVKKAKEETLSNDEAVWEV